MSYEKAAQIAGKWWAERLDPQYQDKQQQFAEEIARLVLEAFQDGSKVINHDFVRLECDYDPCGILLTALHNIGIACDGFMFSARGILPEKHMLKIYKDHLEPKEGYGNWTEEIPVPQD